MLCKVFEDIRHGYELIHVVQAPQTVADLYQQKDFIPVAIGTSSDQTELLDHKY